MSQFSRRSLLGYTGTAAAGAVFATAGTSEAAGRDEPATAAEATTTSTSATNPVEFVDGTEFRADQSMSESDLMMEMSFKVRVDKPNGCPSAQDITPLEVAEALSALAQSKGWPPLTFYGTPAPAPLNSCGRAGAETPRRCGRCTAITRDRRSGRPGVLTRSARARQSGPMCEQNPAGLLRMQAAPCRPRHRRTRPTSSLSARFSRT
ncbi:hypothetical protein ABZ565_04535 [Streptomyces sp. NPDC016469]|uniref:hypothetical protein n=1 Tax=Streptomyces sp. NPDC016469 TaxID=3157191 RepID=UPI0033FF44E3